MKATIIRLARSDRRYLALAAAEGYLEAGHPYLEAMHIYWPTNGGGYYNQSGEVAEFSNAPILEGLRRAQALGSVDIWVGLDPRQCGAREPSYPDVRFENGNLEIC